LGRHWNGKRWAANLSKQQILDLVNEVTSPDPGRVVRGAQPFVDEMRDLSPALPDGRYPPVGKANLASLS